MKLRIQSSKNKTMMEPEPEPAVPLAATSSMLITKKLRSKRPRGRRSQIAPVVLQKEAIDISVDYGSCCNFDAAADVSCDSSSVSNQKKKRKFAEVGYGAKANKNLGNEGTGDSQFRRITRSYSKKEREAKGNEAEVSESSCVESNSGADFLVFGERSSKLKKVSENLEKPEKNDAVSISLGVTTTRSDISSVELIPHGISKLPSENKENDLVSVTSGFEYSSTSKFDTAIKENVKAVVDANFTVLNSESVVDQKPKSFSGLDSSHLACNEQFSLDEVVLLSDCSSSQKTVFSELQSDFFSETSDLDFSDYTPSLSYDSGSQFSEKSNDDSPTSVAYSLFLDFKQQFSRSTFHLDPKLASRAEDDRQINSTLVRIFENEEDEESYKRLRERERRQVYLHDYAEEYRLTTDYGDLILLQRSFMIRWITEQCTAKEFQQETNFIGVGLLDRFLSKGFFRNKRSLQIVGIACLVLATRIEENQPYNSVRQKNFYIGTNTYSRNEVVAMEWLVMEVLNFQCFLPTIYNFLWFYLKAAKADADVEKRAKYLAVLALSDHEQLRYWPSTVAAGIVIMASMDGNQHGSYHQVIEIHMRTKDNDLPECMKGLDWLVQYIR